MDKPKIGHDKVMVIDGETVITGSSNFSANAECCNAENLLVIRRPSPPRPKLIILRGGGPSAQPTFRRDFPPLSS
jgi:phosphatidylserine/phosphatidylglycerophosphate/cardiolipin synthase-like enzyme